MRVEAIRLGDEADQWLVRRGVLKVGIPGHEHGGAGRDPGEEERPCRHNDAHITYAFQVDRDVGDIHAGHGLPPSFKGKLYPAYDGQRLFSKPTVGI